MKIRWSPEAEAATRGARTIYDGCDRLREFPRVGRTSRRMPGWRELVFPSLPYIVVYLVTEEAVERTGHSPAVFLTMRCEARGERLLCFTNPRIYFPGGCTSPYGLKREMVYDLQDLASGAKIRAFNRSEVTEGCVVGLRGEGLNSQMGNANGRESGQLLRHLFIERKQQHFLVGSWRESKHVFNVPMAAGGIHSSASDVFQEGSLRPPLNPPPLP